MAETFKIASFNVENLFRRAKIFNFRNHSVGDQILATIDAFRKLLQKDTYTAQDKQDIFNLYDQNLKDYIFVREDRGKLWKRAHVFTIVGVDADTNGSGDWDGTIEFKDENISQAERENTARVLRAVRADLACIVEAESRPILRSFDAELLNSSYKYELLIDANDPRGIDVGVYSKFPIGSIRTHMFDKKGNAQIFSRDCLEVEVFVTEQQPLYLLCNHFKSRGYDPDGTGPEKRERQARRVLDILGNYDLTTDWVVVAGDFNDNPDSVPLQSLLNAPNMFDVLKLEYPDDANKRWTYHFNTFEQIDFILVSKPLSQRFKKAGVERRGMYDLKKLTTDSNGLVDIETQFDTVTHWTNAASDHGAVWAEFKFQV